MARCSRSNKLCDNVCQWLAAAGLWCSSSTPVSFTNKTDRHGITEILLKVALKHLNPNPNFIHANDLEYILRQPLSPFVTPLVGAMRNISHGGWCLLWWLSINQATAFLLSTNLFSQMSSVVKGVLWQRLLVYQICIRHVSFFNYTKVFFKKYHTI